MFFFSTQKFGDVLQEMHVPKFIAMLAIFSKYKWVERKFTEWAIKKNVIVCVAVYLRGKAQRVEHVVWYINIGN